MKIGLHVPGDFFDLGLNLKGRPVQLCVGSPLSLPSIALAKTVRDDLSSLSLERKNITVHSSFLINLASVDEKKRKRAIGMGKFSLRVGEIIGCNAIVFHAGSGLPSVLVKSLQELLTTCTKRSPRILIENDCGGGKRIGSVRVLAAIKERLEGQIGLCFDTMHSYGRGETRDFEGLKKAFDYCEPELLHLNSPNPECEFGDHRDRHKCQIDEGKYGGDIMEFCCWVGDRVPMVLEQPIDIALAGLEKVEKYCEKRCEQSKGKLSIKVK